MTLPLPDQNVIPRRLPDMREMFEEHRKSFEGVQRNLDEIAMQFPIQASNLANVALTSSLPSSPRHGAQVLYSPSDGVVWPVVFDSRANDADGYGWVVIGGAPIVGDYTDANGHTTTSTSYTSLTGGPSISLPRAGVWDVSVGCAAHSGDDNQAGYMSYAIGATAASDDDSVRLSYGGGNSGQPDGGSAWTTRRKTVGAVTLASRYRVSGGTTRFYRRRLVAMPVRLAS